MAPVTNSSVNQDVGKDANASKLRGECQELAAASYRCLEKGDYEACKPFFEDYKICRKNEHSKIIENRRSLFK